jgi:hypothetical protein
MAQQLGSNFAKNEGLMSRQMCSKVMPNPRQTGIKLVTAMSRQTKNV